MLERSRNQTADLRLKLHDAKLHGRQRSASPPYQIRGRCAIRMALPGLHDQWSSNVRGAILSSTYTVGSEKCTQKMYHGDL